MKKVVSIVLCVLCATLIIGCNDSLNTGSISLQINPLASWVSEKGEEVSVLAAMNRGMFADAQVATEDHDISTRAYAIATRIVISLYDDNTGTLIDSWELPDSETGDWNFVKEVPIGSDYLLTTEIYNEFNDPAEQYVCIGVSDPFTISPGMTTTVPVVAFPINTVPLVYATDSVSSSLDLLQEKWFTAVAQDTITTFSVTATQGDLVIGVFDEAGYYQGEVSTTDGDDGSLTLETTIGELYYIGLLGVDSELTSSGYVSFRGGDITEYPDLIIDIIEMEALADDMTLSFSCRVSNVSDVAATQSFDIDFWEDRATPPVVGDLSSTFMTFTEDIPANGFVDFVFLMDLTMDSGTAYVVVNTTDIVQEEDYTNNVDGMSWSVGSDGGSLPADIYEPDDLLQDAAFYDMNTEGVQHRTLHHNDDYDYLRISCTAGSTLTVTTSPPAECPKLVDTVIFLLDEEGQLIAGNDDSGEGLYSRLVQPITETGSYFIKVITYHNYASGPQPGYDYGGYYDILCEAGSGSSTGYVDIVILSEPEGQKGKF